MTTEATATASTEDALNGVAHAMQTAAAAAREGAADASAKVQELLPRVSEFVSSGVYNGSYYAAYGLVFPTLYLCHIIPGGKSVADGLRDGAQAATDYVRELRG